MCQVLTKSVIWAVSPPAWFSLVFSWTHVSEFKRDIDIVNNGSMVHLFHTIYTKTTMHINENTLTTHSLYVQFKLEVIHQIKQCNTVWMMPCYVKHCLNDPGLTASFSIRTDTQLTSITCHTFQTDMIEQSPKPSECHSFDTLRNLPWFPLFVVSFFMKNNFISTN